MDQIFFWLSKTMWLCISPDIIFVAALFITLVYLWRKSYIKALVLLNIVFILVFTIHLLPVGHWLLHPLETRFKPLRKLPEKVDGVIVLGGAENIYTTFQWQQVETGPSAERFFAFIQLVRQYPEAKHVFTGGSGSLKFQKMKGAMVAKLLFEQQGLDTSNMIFESESRNTYENAKNTYRIMNPSSDEKWLLITSASHMPRSVGCFRKSGWSVIPYSVDHFTHSEERFRIQPGFSTNFKMLKYAFREWVGLAAYYTTGKTSALFPEP